MRVDTISNPSSSDWFLVGGAGVQYGTFTKNKNGLTPGQTYRGQARTWCDPNGGAIIHCHGHHLLRGHNLRIG